MFPVEQAWMINPHSSKTRRRRKSARRTTKGAKTMAKRRRSRKGKEPAGLKAYRLGKRRKKASSNPPRRRRRRAVRSAAPKRRRKSVRTNAPRRARRRSSSSRSYRRNPNLNKGFIMDAVYVTGGFFATRFTAGFVLPMIPMADTPIVRILSKGALAWGLGFAGEKVVGHRNGQLLMLGGLVEVLSDAVRTYVSPYVPALADYSEMGSYPSLSSYPTMSGEYSNPYQVGSDHDEAL